MSAPCCCITPPLPPDSMLPADFCRLLSPAPGTSTEACGSLGEAAAAVAPEAPCLAASSGAGVPSLGESRSTASGAAVSPAGEASLLTTASGTNASCLPLRGAAAGPAGKASCPASKDAAVRLVPEVFCPAPANAAADGAPRWLRCGGVELLPPTMLRVAPISLALVGVASASEVGSSAARAATIRGSWRGWLGGAGSSGALNGCKVSVLVLPAGCAATAKLGCCLTAGSSCCSQPLAGDAGLSLVGAMLPSLRPTSVEEVWEGTMSLVGPPCMGT